MKPPGRMPSTHSVAHRHCGTVTPPRSGGIADAISWRIPTATPEQAARPSPCRAGSTWQFQP
eukprot:8879718-Pyramimonas_sp.AAC.1